MTVLSETSIDTKYQTIANESSGKVNNWINPADRDVSYAATDLTGLDSSLTGNQRDTGSTFRSSIIIH